MLKRISEETTEAFSCHEHIADEVYNMKKRINSYGTGFFSKQVSSATSMVKVRLCRVSGCNRMCYLKP